MSALYFWFILAWFGPCLSTNESITFPAREGSLLPNIYRASKPKPQTRVTMATSTSTTTTKNLEEPDELFDVLEGLVETVPLVAEQMTAATAKIDLTNATLEVDKFGFSVISQRTSSAVVPYSAEFLSSSPVSTTPAAPKYTKFTHQSRPALFASTEGTISTGKLETTNAESPSPTTSAPVIPVMTNMNAMAALLHNIFHNYKKEIIPNKPVHVQMDLLLLKVKSTIEREGILETVLALLIEWRDNRFVWDPRRFDNVTVLAFDSFRVWLPDIAMTNSADHLYTLSRDPRFVVRVSHDGNMKFVPTGTARTWCALNLEAFPFDIQTCSIDFESWSLDSSMMVFNDSATILVDESFSSTQWEFCKHHTIAFTHDYYTGESFGCLRYEFVLKRKSTFYVINLIFPCATLSLIQLLAFTIPSTKSTSDRIGFGTTNLLTLVVFQTIVTAEMPKSNEFTALSKYVISLIVISCFGIMQSVFVERMLHISARPPPRFLFRLLQHIAPFLPALWQQPVASPDIVSCKTKRGERRRSSFRLTPNRAPSVVAKEQQSLSVLMGITAGSSLLATAAVMHGKKNLPKRKQSKAAYLKKMTAQEDHFPIQLNQQEQTPPVIVVEHLYRKRKSSAHHHNHHQHHHDHQEQQQPLKPTPPPRPSSLMPPPNVRVNPLNYQEREELENQRLLMLGVESGLLGRSPSGFDVATPTLHLSHSAFSAPATPIKKQVRLEVVEDEDEELEPEEEQDESVPKTPPQVKTPSSSSSTSSGLSSIGSDERSSTYRISTVGGGANKLPKASADVSAAGWLFQAPSNDELWAELVTRLDFLTLSIGAALNIGIPLSLFLPLYLREDTQCSATH